MRRPVATASSSGPAASRRGNAPGGWSRSFQGAPLSLWENEFRRSAADLVALPVVGDFARELHAGWRAATGVQQNRTWARAFLDARGAPADPSLVSVLPPGEQVAYARRLLDSVDAGDGVVPLMLTAVDGPWPAELATGVVGYVERLLAHGAGAGVRGTAAARRAPAAGPDAVHRRDHPGPCHR